MSRGSAALFTLAAGIVVLAALVAGFLAVGSPTRARLQRQDAERVQDLSSISTVLEAYAALHHGLPEALATVRARGNIPSSSLRDPVSGAPYEYRTTGVASYEICALFSTATNEAEDSVWSHRAGRSCFRREVDSLPAAARPAIPK